MHIDFRVINDVDRRKLNYALRSQYPHRYRAEIFPYRRANFFIFIIIVPFRLLISRIS